MDERDGARTGSAMLRRDRTFHECRMKKSSKSASTFALAAVLACAAAHGASAPGVYPAKPIRLIVPFSPGGSADNLARTIQPALTATLGQPLVIDNRGG